MCVYLLGRGGEGKEGRKDSEEGGVNGEERKGDEFTQRALVVMPPAFVGSKLWPQILKQLSKM